VPSLAPQTTTHIVIPDSQIRPGVPTEFLTWIGRYIVDHFYGKPNVRVIHLGDFADMHSLSGWNKRMDAEGLRYGDDIEAANAAFDLLNAPLRERNARQRRRLGPDACWVPDRHILLGNHEDRIDRVVADDPRLFGALTTDDLDYARQGWTVHPFLRPVDLDGVWYAHYFYAPLTGRPLGGLVQTRLKTLGHSFTMGHVQTLDYAVRYVAGRSQHGLVAGACYLHDEDYKGPQGNAHWRGIVVCHQVDGGSYDPMMVSLDYLCRRYTGVDLGTYRRDALGMAA
jgi:hypothetical protein